MEYSEVINKIENFISRKVEEAGANGVVLGLSGGIDSSVVAYLSKKALGSKNVFGLIMPSETTKEEDVKDAISIAKNLGINYEIINIEPILKKFRSMCKHKGNKIAIANLGPRVRMTILYYHSNSLNSLVAGTGNKSELLIGYFTKYGDGGVDILPIGDLYKTQVRKIAYELGVPKKIIEKPPSAGLWRGQTDEDEIGLDYETLDKILFLMVEKKLKNHEIHEKLGIPLKTIGRVEEMIKNAEHKLNPPEVARIW
nr:NAD+ synthase [Methanothermus fervidus]